MRFNLFFALSVAMVFAACSQSVSSPSDDEETSAVSSSSKKGISSSSMEDEKLSSGSTDKQTKSSSSVDELDDDCVGEAAEPWNGTTAKDFACGAGTKLSPYVILTAEQLAHLSFVVNAGDKDYSGKYFKLGADIKLNKGDIIDEKGALVGDSTKLHKWTPIGNSSVAFDGNFDGAGHTISGMFINTTSTHNGLFGQSSGTIDNLTLTNSWVYGGKYTAGIVGRSTGSVENVENLASVESQEPCIGGVIGESYYKKYPENSVIKNVLNKGIIVGKNNVGGVVGCATYVTVDDAENFATIEGFAYVGGVFGGIGSSNTNDLKNLKNSGAITGKHFVGGISGYCGGSISLNSTALNKSSTYSCYDFYACGKIQKAYNDGNINGLRYVGGIIGEVCYGTIDNLVNKGNITGEGGTGGIVSSMSYTKSKLLYNVGDISGLTYVGGIAGYNQEGVTSSAYSTGKVDGDSLVGLMIGYNYNTTMADYYYLEQGDQESFGLNNGGGVATPKTADEMKSEDFAELLGETFTYDSGLNDGFPVLVWEKE